MEVSHKPFRQQTEDWKGYTFVCENLFSSGSLLFNSQCISYHINLFFLCIYVVFQNSY